MVEVALPEGAKSEKNEYGETLIDFCGETYLVSECIKQHSNGTYWIEVCDGNGCVRKKLEVVDAKTLESLKKYRLRYDRNGKHHEVAVYAIDAVMAIKKYCNRYGWTYKVRLIDADTHGTEWCEAGVDTIECRTSSPQPDIRMDAFIIPAAVPPEKE